MIFIENGPVVSESMEDKETDKLSFLFTGLFAKLFTKFFFKNAVIKNLIFWIFKYLIKNHIFEFLRFSVLLKYWLVGMTLWTLLSFKWEPLFCTVKICM